MAIQCSRCGSDNRENSPYCVNCGAPLSVPQRQEPVFTPQPQPQPQPYQKPCINCNRMMNASLAVCPYCASNQFIAQPQHNKLVAGLLAILLGSFGVHKFYLGQPAMGVLYLLFCWTFIPSLVGIIEGIMYLSMSDGEFYQKYR